MMFYVKSAALAILLLSMLLLSMLTRAQDTIAVGTVLPVQLNTSVNSRNNKPGQQITARIMQDVPLSHSRKIPTGAKVHGRVLRISPAKNAGAAQVTFAFDGLQYRHTTVPIRTDLRALASMMEVEAAQVPPSGPDRGTPWAWTTKNLIGGEVAYGEGGPVARGAKIVGRAVLGGVLLPLQPNRNSKCGDQEGSDQPQALWVFSSDACGLYGVEDLNLTHAGRTAPIGEITLTSNKDNVLIRSGSGLLLRVIDSGAK